MEKILSLLKMVVPHAIECAKRIVGIKTKFTTFIVDFTSVILKQSKLQVTCFLQTVSGLQVRVTLFYQSIADQLTLDQSHVTFQECTWAMQFDGMLRDKPVLIT